MPKTKVGLGVAGAFEHRKGGKELVVKSVPRPMLACKRPRCIARHALVLWWDTLRVGYIEAKYYREGDVSGVPMYVREGDIEGRNVLKEILRVYFWRIFRR